jgi:hypothetical protein
MTIGTHPNKNYDLTATQDFLIFYNIQPQSLRFAEFHFRVVAVAMTPIEFDLLWELNEEEHGGSFQFTPLTIIFKFSTSYTPVQEKENSTLYVTITNIANYPLENAKISVTVESFAKMHNATQGYNFWEAPFSIQPNETQIFAFKIMIPSYTEYLHRYYFSENIAVRIGSPLRNFEWYAMPLSVLEPTPIPSEPIPEPWWDIGLLGWISAGIIATALAITYYKVSKRVRRKES